MSVVKRLFTIRFSSGFIRALLPFVVLQAGCVVSRQEGDIMRADIQQLRKNVADLQYSQDQFRSRLSDLEKLGEDVAVTKRAGAESGAEMDRVRDEMRSLRGEIEKLQFELESYKEKAASFPVEPSEEQQETKKDIPEVDRLFNEGNSHYQNAENTKGAEQKEFYNKSVVVFQKLLTKYPKYAKVDEVLWLVGQSLDALGFPKDAKIFYEEILKKHPKSKRANEAKSHLAPVKGKK